MIIDENGNVGIGTIGRVPNASAKLHVQDGSVLFQGTTGATPVSGAGTRLMWIPAKAAFRAGEVTGTEWDDANIGSHSFAAGGWTTNARGNFSVALGDDTSTGFAGTSAFAAGSQSQANGTVSIALGDVAVATGDHSHAYGSSATANGGFSTAMGFYVTADGNSSMVLGRGVNNGARLGNGIDNSLAVGFNSTIPTVFVGPSAGAGKTGNVGVGTSTPLNGAPAVPTPDPTGGGNLDVNDIYLRSTGQWVSTAAGGGAAPLYMRCAYSANYGAGTGARLNFTGVRACHTDLGLDASCGYVANTSKTSLITGTLCTETTPGIARSAWCCHPSATPPPNPDTP